MLIAKNTMRDDRNAKNTRKNRLMANPNWSTVETTSKKEVPQVIAAIIRKRTPFLEEAGDEDIFKN